MTGIDIEHIIDRIHEAATVPELWPEVLEAIAQAAGAHGMVMITSDSDPWAGVWNGVVTSPSIQEAFAAFMREGISSRTETTPRLLAFDHPGFVSEQEVFSLEEWERDPYRVEWNKKWGFEHACATAVHSPSGELIVFHMERLAGRPAFSRQDLDFLDRFRPHLARAALLSTRWRLTRMRAATEALALVGLPALAIARSGRVMAVNALIEGMTDVLRWLPKDQFAIRDGAADTLLRAGLAQLGSPETPVCSFAARRTNADPVVFHLVSMPGEARDLFNGAVGLLIVTPVTASQAPSLALIRGLFDLTPSEARVARGIAQGQTIGDIAAHHGLSRETIRTQIKAVLAKTGTRNQKSAAALFGAIPRLPLND
ncbi:LuxR family transcriptional regulator [Bradyrhizobium sp. INPA01-394B]|uniref:LuxR family transcriptional regulator n=1 Tax=Bradyrhizobium campsiandrae TaxID=1729892 RepID=A0ABR7U202_9BRAD|nr:helix-turn-helix transcriptional regulator [Bradyrhizobium campsiandrae]MBC9883092.1 LuxR family transcriptional regulator [Bradyrhizobium campsiandrae]MBC9978054.1 LuxR family transcriptional regulator [Bradyrhizobium campsiandrae]